MSRRLVILNAVLVVVAVTAVGYIVRELRVKPAPVSAPVAAAPVPVAAPPPAPAPPTGGSAVVASRNLFSPTRSESVAPSPAAAAAAALPKPNLFGVLLRETAPVAYLEDPTTKRVAAYRLGDSIAGGTVTKITADQVVLNRPEGDVNVRLRDPSKPRPPAPVATPTLPGAPGAPVVPGGRGVQPLVPGAAQATPPGSIVQSPPGATGQPDAPVLPRRPLPPNLLRRLPPSGADAPAQQ